MRHLASSLVLERRTDLSIQDWRVDDDAGWGTQGKWQIKIIDAGLCDAQVRWKNPIEERQLVLHVGNQCFTGSLAANDAMTTFPAINLPLRYPLRHRIRRVYGARRRSGQAALRFRKVGLSK